ncbi:MAG: trigger factor [Clostridia bacterium]|nr:trigger factor [Clostridia bacterium]
MLKSTNNVEKNVYELEITIDGAKFEAAIQKAYLKVRKDITINGFRKGKAPRAFIEKIYGEGVFYEDALELVYPEAVSEAIVESKLEVVGMPYDLEVPEIGKDGVVLKLKVAVKPEVELGEYKGLKATRPSCKVAADEVKAELAKMQEQNSRMISVDDRAVKKNDTAVIDFEGFVDGVAFDGGKAEKYELVIGSGSFIPGFEDQIIGHKIGEEFDVNVTFPAEYQENLASKDAVFKIKLHEIKVKELPALDDDFAMDLGSDNLDALKKSVKKQLEDAKKADADGKIANDLLEEVVKGMKVDVPAAMIEAEIDNIVDNFNYRLQAQGLDLNTYLSYTGMEMAAFRDGYKENAEAQVKLSLAIEAIAKAEGIEATEDEISAEYENLAKMYAMDVDAVKKAIPVDSLASDIKSKKAIDFVKDNAVITDEKATKKTAEKKETAEKAPAKKPAAKKKADDAEKVEKKPAAKKTTKKKADAE